MSRPINEQAWHRMTEEIMSGMREWRAQHPKATLREMEDELDRRWARVRARMLEDMALASAATDWTATPNGQQPTCPDCGQPMVDPFVRLWRTLRDQAIWLLTYPLHNRWAVGDGTATVW